MTPAKKPDQFQNVIQHQEMIELMEKFGMLEGQSIMQDYLAHWDWYEFREGENGLRLYHKATNELADSIAHLQWLQREKFFWFPQKVQPDLVEQAFGSAPTLKARGELIKQMHRAEYDQLARKWNSDPVSLKPGRNPDGVPANNVVPIKSSSNPWSAVGNTDERGRYTKQALTRQGRIVTELGIAAAQRMAAAQHSYVGSTGPGARRLIPRG